MIENGQLPAPPIGRTGWPWTEVSSRMQAKLASDTPWPRITIVTPSFNQGQFIEETICSVLNQGYPNLEYIIIDGGSTDNSVEVIKRYEHRLSYWISEPDQGQAHALNKGFALATGDIYGFLNSDDIFLPISLSTVGRHFASVACEATISTFAGIEFGGATPEIRYEPPRTLSLSWWLSSGGSLFQPATFWTCVLHRRAGNFLEDLFFCFDKEFFIRAAFVAGKYRPGVDTVVAGFRRHAASKTSTAMDVCLQENELIWKMYKNHPTTRRILQHELCREFSHRKIIQSLECKSLCEAWQHLLRAGIANPSLLMNRFYLGACRRALFRLF